MLHVLHWTYATIIREPATGVVEKVGGDDHHHFLTPAHTRTL